MLPRRHAQDLARKRRDEATMERSKLDALRATYQNAAPGEARDPRFKKALELIFAGTDRRPKPYEGVSTFLGARLASVAERGLDVALVGVPMDLGVTNRSGARFGPRAVRAVERVGPYHHVHALAPLAEMKVADVGDVPFQSRFSLERSHADIEAYFKALAGNGAAPVSVGGDHSISYPILRALGASRPLALLHIDAHCDTSAPFEGSKFHHGGPFRQAVLDGVLDPERTIQIGIRGGAEYLWEFSYASGMTVVHAEEIPRLGIDAIIAKIRNVVGTAATYVSFDVDALDPAFAPGTGTPEIGGLSTREALALLRGCAGLDVVGGDVVEVAPQYDAGTITAHAAAQILFEIVCLIALAPACAARRKARP
jgi:agmatinase